MNLVEAVKSEKRFRRKGTEHWIERQKGAGPTTFRKHIPAVGSVQVCFHVEDFSSDEWELEPAPAEPARPAKKPSALRRIAAALESIESMMAAKKKPV